METKYRKSFLRDLKKLKNQPVYHPIFTLAFDLLPAATYEPREIIIGHLRDRRLCLVVFTEISEDRLRIISARLATPKEQRDYERNTR